MDLAGFEDVNQANSGSSRILKIEIRLTSTLYKYYWDSTSYYYYYYDYFHQH